MPAISKQARFTSLPAEWPNDLLPEIQAQVAAHTATETPTEGQAEADAGGGMRRFVGGFAEGLEEAFGAGGADFVDHLGHGPTLAD